MRKLIIVLLFTILSACDMHTHRPSIHIELDIRPACIETIPWLVYWVSGFPSMVLTGINMGMSGG